MTKIYSIIIFIFIVIPSINFAEEVIFKGKVNSDGTPTKSISLKLGEKYQIRVSGTMNLGKWWQAGKPLLDDAAFEFNDNIDPSPIHTFRNSLNISVGDGTFHPDHKYDSLPFVASQSAIHFWIYDTNYDDNHGELDVEVVKL